jgi:hypothetical protein
VDRRKRSFLIALALPFLGAGFGAIATFLGLGIASIGVWQPVYSAGDLDSMMLLLLAPLCVSAMMLVVSIAYLVVYIFASTSRWLLPILILISLVPGLVMFLAVRLGGTGLTGGEWKFPGAEMIVCLIGITWAVIAYHALRRATA